MAKKQRTKNDKLKEVQAKMGVGFQKPSEFYALVDGKMEVGVGDNKTWVEKTWVINGTSRFEAEGNARDFITENNGVVKGAHVTAVYPYRK